MLTGQLLLQLIVILLVVQIFAYLSKKIGQQRVIGEILAGLALGPSLLGLLWPHLELQLFPLPPSLPARFAGQLFPERSTLQTLGDIGLILYMFSLGVHLDINLMLRQSRNAAIISISSILLPLVLGGILGVFLYPSLKGSSATLLSFVLLVGTAMSITAFPVLARLLSEKKMLGIKVGMLALTSAAVGDIIAWCLLAYVIAVAHAHGTLSVLYTVGLIILFAAGILLMVRPMLDYIVRRVQLESLQMAICLFVLLGAAYITDLLSIHPIFGAFLAGIIMPRNAAFTSHIRSLDRINTVLFLPVYFVFSGLNTQIGLLQGLSSWLICLLIFAAASVGKIVGGTLATRMTGNSWRDALSLGLLMNTRGLVELIVLNIGLQEKILSPTLFAMLVIMAIVTTMMVSPLLPLLGHRSSADQDEVVQEMATAVDLEST
ncbi:hypothetical protein EPA93_02885 [Ktedonosporobacter rubrisoli]|uniref:Cation/H+ exchanger transmembrane domain-containing protein n=1 Tax=Ktedonosporobacter rubrisoli TaxID=2509675 RepID=A0A4P6JJ06_KTERU|nr:cation:proton antiporter [Ktedonosporobacter rubrisoli]QBD74993.1 hypothetical protein EPA93_02885 [Ktedonosporobacter rubrisoli]